MMHSDMKRNKVLIHATTRMNLKNMPNERNQTDTQVTYYMITFI